MSRRVKGEPPYHWLDPRAPHPPRMSQEQYDKFFPEVLVEGKNFLDPPRRMRVMLTSRGWVTIRAFQEAAVIHQGAAEKLDILDEINAKEPRK